MPILRQFVSGLAGGVGAAALAFLLYAILLSTLHYAIQPRVSAQARERLDMLDCCGGAEDGPDRAALVESTTDAYAARIQLVRAAQSSIDLVYHSFGGGMTTAAFAWEVWQAAERGVQVRLLLDGKVGLPHGDAVRAVRLLRAHPNVEYRTFNPIHLLKPWTWHVLLHDKFILADHRYLLLGGRNLGDKYFAPSAHTAQVTEDRDVLVWDTGIGQGRSVIPQLEDYMQTLWAHPASRAGKPRATNGAFVEKELLRCALAAQTLTQRDTPFYTRPLRDFLAATVPTKKICLLHNPVTTRRKEPWVAYQMRRFTLRASRQVLVQTPYATAHRELLAALHKVAGQAMVTLVTNSTASSPNLPAYSNYISQRAKFVSTGVQVYEFQGQRSIHGKSVLVDGRLAMVGSFNLDERSFFIDTETMLTIDSEPFAEALSTAIYAYRDQSLLVGKDNRPVKNPAVPTAPVPAGKKVLMFLSSLFSRLFHFLI